MVAGQQQFYFANARALIAPPIYARVELAAASVKRVRFADEAGAAWLEDTAQGLDAIRGFVEFKTTWHPIGS